MSSPEPAQLKHGRIRHRIAALFATAALAAGGLLAPAVAHAAFPGGNGKIYYVSGHNVFSVNPDGTGAAQLTTNGSDSIAVINPAGTKVAFLHFDFNSFTDQVFTMNPDGSDQMQLTSASSADSGVLAWSPDGAKLVYAPGDTLTVINADGSSPVSLGVSSPQFAAWSPDGTEIAYIDGNGNLSTVHPDGTGQALLAAAPAGLFDSAPTWSPDGTELAFSASDGNGGNGQIYTIHADGTDQTTILADANDDELPVWSPDGTKIAFYASGALETMNPDGSGETPVGTVSGLPTDWASIPTAAPAATTTAVASATNPSAFGQPAVFTATVTGGDGGGSVAFYADGSATPLAGCEAVALSPVGSAFQATCTTSDLDAGSHIITASYSGDAGSAASSGTLAGGQTVLQGSTTTVSSSENPAPSGDEVTFTATVINDGGGTVAFYADGSSTPLAGCGAVALADPAAEPFTATCTTSSLAIGHHAITAVYSGDDQYAASSGTLAGGQDITPVTTTTTVSSSANPSIVGQPVTFTATVSGDGGGTVAFYADGSSTPLTGCGAVTLADPPSTPFTATCTTSGLAVGNHPIAANYSGDAQYAASTGTLAGGQTVKALTASATTVSSSANPSASGQAVTFTATVTGDGGGTVAFYADGSSTPLTGCGAVALTGPAPFTATCTTSGLSVGNHPIAANYSGDAQFAASTGSLAGGQTVNRVATTTTVSSSANPSMAGQSVTFTATVTGDGGGTVAFYADGSSTPLTGCGAVALTGPAPFTATCTTSGLSVGNHPITAAYTGDAQYAPSTGTLAGGQTVNRVATVITSASTLQLFAAGGTAAVSATLTSTGGTPVPGKTVTITLGTGSSAQSCTATTSSSGTAACTITPVTTTTGPLPLTDAFAGDGSYISSANTQQALVFAYTTGGSFTVGDGSQTGAVTFWGAKWAKDNTLSGGSAPSSFKGFENSAAQPGCGTNWTTGPGNSPSPPASPLPSYIAVIATSTVSSSGSTIAGNTVNIVIVKTNSGYAPDPGHAGTGTVVGTVC